MSVVLALYVASNCAADTVGVGFGVGVGVRAWLSCVVAVIFCVTCVDCVVDVSVGVCGEVILPITPMSKKTMIITAVAIGWRRHHAKRR